MPKPEVAKERSPEHRFSSPLIWALGAGIVGFATLVVVGVFFVTVNSERIRFVTVNVLSLLVLLAILVQTYIYNKQWQVMQQGLAGTDRMIEKMQGQLDVMRQQVVASETQFRVAMDGIRVPKRILSMRIELMSLQSSTELKKGSRFTCELKTAETPRLTMFM